MWSLWGSALHNDHAFSLSDLQCHPLRTSTTQRSSLAFLGDIWSGYTIYDHLCPSGLELKLSSHCNIIKRWVIRRWQRLKVCAFTDGMKVYRGSGENQVVPTFLLTCSILCKNRESVHFRGNSISYFLRNREGPSLFNKGLLVLLFLKRSKSKNNRELKEKFIYRSRHYTERLEWADSCLGGSIMYFKEVLWIFIRWKVHSCGKVTLLSFLNHDRPDLLLRGFFLWSPKMGGVKTTVQVIVWHPGGGGAGVSVENAYCLPLYTRGRIPWCIGFWHCGEN